MLNIHPAESKEDLEIVKQLFAEHASLIFELFRPHSLPLAERLSQQVLNEANDLPGEYIFPKGCILLAELKGVTAGCIAMSEIAEGLCELKRIYVKPQFRRMGVGKRMADAIIKKAILLNYKRMRLGTNTLFVGAKELYISLGFKETGHIEGSPLKDSVNMELKLA